MFKEIKTIHLLKSFIFDYMRFFLLSILFFPLILFCQNNKKDILAKRINHSVTIDGKLNEPFWSDIEPAQNFQMIEPINGKIERSTQTTIVKFAYDDTGIYIGAQLNDKNAGYDDPNMVGIMQELGTRDERNKSTDVFGIFLNPFNDGINEFAFLVTAAGVQIDYRNTLMTYGYMEDINWDAVWESSVTIEKDRWNVEIKIPYSAIRFPKKDVQEWGLNIYREIRRLREGYSWNPIDLKNKHIGNQAGTLRGIKNIAPPIRLSITPEVSSILKKEPNQSHDFNYYGGANLKWIFDAKIKEKNYNSTLDVTILPNFQQVEFDPLILNTTPYEEKYEEKRSFFTEGTELFNKGGLFYSRRIGAKPQYTTQQNEEIIDSPTYTELYNAIKLSSRTSDGLGIGLFNAFTKNTYVTTRDTMTEQIKESLVPITNYNMIVIDKSFNQNSFLTLVNTNVSRKNDLRKANVFGLLGSITNSKKTFSYDFSLKGSFIKDVGSENQQANNINQEEWIGLLHNTTNKPIMNKNGFASSLNIQRINKNFTYGIEHYIESDLYDINDMGYLQEANEVNTNMYINYKVFSSEDPIAKKLKIKKGWIRFDTEHKMLYKPFSYSKIIMKFNAGALNLNHFYMDLGIRYFLEEHDYSLTGDNKFFIKPPAIKISIGTSSNFNKPVSLNLRGSLKYRLSNNYTIWEDRENTHFYGRFNPRFRINNHAFLEYICAIEKIHNELGTTRYLEPLFSNRFEKAVTNKLIFTYVFNNKLNTTVNARYYWKTVKHTSFYDLLNNGMLTHSNEFGNNQNYNIWTLYTNLTWEYKPGSTLSVVWQNILEDDNEVIENIFFNNVNDFIENTPTNIFSVKFTAYLDYSTIFKRKIK